MSGVDPSLITLSTEVDFEHHSRTVLDAIVDLLRLNNPGNDAIAIVRGQGAEPIEIHAALFERMMDTYAAMIAQIKDFSPPLVTQVQGPHIEDEATMGQEGATGQSSDARQDSCHQARDKNSTSSINRRRAWYRRINRSRPQSGRNQTKRDPRPEDFDGDDLSELADDCICVNGTSNCRYHTTSDWRGPLLVAERQKDDYYAMRWLREQRKIDRNCTLSAQLDSIRVSESGQSGIIADANLVDRKEVDAQAMHDKLEASEVNQTREGASRSIEDQDPDRTETQQVIDVALACEQEFKKRSETLATLLEGQEHGEALGLHGPKTTFMLYSLDYLQSGADATPRARYITFSSSATQDTISAEMFLHGDEYHTIGFKPFEAPRHGSISPTTVKIFCGEGLNTRYISATITFVNKNYIELKMPRQFVVQRLARHGDDRIRPVACTSEPEAVRFVRFVGVRESCASELRRQRQQEKRKFGLDECEDQTSNKIRKVSDEGERVLTHDRLRESREEAMAKYENFGWRYCHTFKHTKLMEEYSGPRDALELAHTTTTFTLYSADFLRYGATPHHIKPELTFTPTEEDDGLDVRVSLHGPGTSPIILEAIPRPAFASIGRIDTDITSPIPAGRPNYSARIKLVSYDTMFFSVPASVALWKSYTGTFNKEDADAAAAEALESLHNIEFYGFRKESREPEVQVKPEDVEDDGSTSD